MNKLKILAIAAAAAALACSCARTDSTGLNDANKRYFDAWMKLHYPDAVRDGLGVYIIDETVGDGPSVGSVDDFPYVYVVSTTRDLEGNVTETSDALIAQQVGTYSDSKYYGPTIKLRTMTTLSAGQEMVIAPMRVGGTRTAVIPGWFSTTSYRYETENDYLNSVTGDDCVYTVTVRDAIKDITKWQIDSVETYLHRNYSQPLDSLIYGLYYIQTQAPTDTSAFDSGATVYVNYTGSLLNGKVFDTSDKDTAKDHGLYSASHDYSPLSVTLNDDYKEMEDVVTGFAYAVSKMRKGEKGTWIFISDLGYQGSGSGTIPGFSPLRFDLEMIGTKK